MFLECYNKLRSWAVNNVLKPLMMLRIYDEKCQDKYDSFNDFQHPLS